MGDMRDFFVLPDGYPVISISDLRRDYERLHVKKHGCGPYLEFPNEDQLVEQIKRLLSLPEYDPKSRAQKQTRTNPQQTRTQEQQRNYPLLPTRGKQTLIRE